MVAVSVHRAKPPVVLLHGLMGSGACWGPIARALESDFDVITPDARGHGRSSAPRGGYRYDDLADDVVALVRELGLVRPVLVGHSMGGMTAAVVASRRVLDLRAVVLVDPTFLEPARQREVFESDVAAQHRRALAMTKSELVAEAHARHPHRSLEIIELQAEARLRTSIDAFDVLRPPNPDYREVVRAIDVPALLVIGDEDPVVTPEMARELGLRTEVVENAGHGLPFERPDRLAEILLRELTTLREVTDDDLEIFFEQQREPEANRMAAFPARERDAFMKHWRTNVLVTATTIVRTIVERGAVAGNIESWEHDGRRFVGYWLGSAFWGRGLASAALREFVAFHDKTRPLFAWVALHNPASMRVLEKCGFRRISDGVEEILVELA